MTTSYTSFCERRFPYVTGLARAFSEHARTVYVNPAIGWYQAWIKREPTGVLPDLSSDRLKVFQPYTRTWREVTDYSKRRAHMRFVGHQLKSLLHGHGLIWFHTPEHLGLVERFPNSVSVCNFADGGEAGELHRHDMLQETDYLFPGSLPAFEFCSSLFPEKTFYIPSGTNVRLYEAYDAYRQGGGMPKSEQLIDRDRFDKLVLYNGGVNDRPEFSLIYQLGRQFPTCQFIFSGPQRIRRKTYYFERCQTLPNVFFYNGLQLYEYMYLTEQSDVCIIPYELSEFNLYAHPLKLYDYWWFGKPVVSTWIPTYQLYGDLLGLAQSHREFQSYLHQFLYNGDQPTHAHMRREIARLHDVDFLAQLMISIAGGETDVKGDYFLCCLDNCLRSLRSTE